MISRFAGLLILGFVEGLRFGKDQNYQLEITANVDRNQIEMKACFPENTWLGLGIGGYKMTDSELLFFMAPTDP